MWVVLSRGIIGHSSFQHLYQYQNWFSVNKSESLNSFSFGVQELQIFEFILSNLCFSVFSASKRKLSRVIPRQIDWPPFVLGRKRPIRYVASVELPPSIAIIMYGK